LQVILSGGDLAAPLTNAMTLSANGRFAASGSGIADLTLSLNPANGAIKGGFADPNAKGTTPIKGVVFEVQTNAAGFFLNAGGSGSFILTNQ
jgi:hypothetical protein